MKMPKTVKTVLYIIFWIIIFVAFVMAAIILVFLAAGYKYDIFSGRLEKTGMIYLKSIPRNTSVYLDGELKSQKTPIKIPYLTPKTYNLKLSQEGYIDWQADIRVKPGEVNSFDRIVLFFEKRKTTALAKNASSFKLAPNKNIIAYITKKKDSLNIFNLQTNKASSLYKSKGTISLNSWSANSKRILIKDSKAGLTVITISDPDHPQYILKDTKKNFTNLAWNPANYNSLYGLYKKRIYRINLLNNSAKALKNNVLAFDVSRYNIFYIYNKDNDFRIRKINFEGQGGETLLSINTPAKKIFASYNEKLAILDEDNNLYLYQKTDGQYNLEKLGEQVSSALWGKPQGIIENIVGTEKLGYFTINEIGGFFKKRDPRFKEEENYLITRINDQIKKIDWYSDYEHIFYLAANNIHIVELDGRNDTTLAKNVKDFDCVDDGKSLIILDNSGLKKMTIRK